VDGHTVIAGRPALVAELGLAIPSAIGDTVERAQADGRTVVVASWDNEVRAAFVVADALRDTSAAAIDELKQLGLSVLMLTGDNEPTALAVGRQLGLEPAQVVAEVMPQRKLDVVRDLQREGHVVTMVGDGVNDAAALVQADLGIAMGTGTDVAIEASDITIVRNDLGAVADSIRLSRRTLGTIKANLFWAFAYNVVAIPLAATGLLNPMIAGGAMALSSLFVVSNSVRLFRFTPGARRRSGTRGADAATPSTVSAAAH
jgi:Cu+-exporting ATPase